MLSKHIRISLFGGSNISRAYFPPINHKILVLDIWCPLWAQVNHKSYKIWKVKQTYTIYVISCYSHLKTHSYLNNASWRANVYEYHHLERIIFPARIYHKLSVDRPIKHKIRYLVIWCPLWSPVSHMYY
jgi:hypothetical protein